MRSKMIIIVCVVILCLSACQSNNNIGKEIEKNLTLIIDNKKIMGSSNPNDYIQQNLKSYEDIIKTGNTGLSYLSKQLMESKNNGLREWIMAKACEDILQDKSPVKEWSTGKEWIIKYERSK